MDDTPRILFDLGTDRPILMSPGRLGRPRNTGPQDDGVTGCPFCEGAENLTTEECDAVRAEGTAPGTPGWQARAFPNLYPAAEWHEVIAEGPAHTAHPADLDAAEVAASLSLSRRRLAAAERVPEMVIGFWFKNVGALAGASIQHNHSQVLALPMLPPRLEAERQASAKHGCIHCAELEGAEAEGRVVFDTGHHVLLSPRTPKMPYEVWLLPREHGDDFLRPAAANDLASALRSVYSALGTAFDRGPFNCWLHRIPGSDFHCDFHWHFEFQPRLGQLAGLELGGEVYINALTPQASARRWACAPSS